jgi:hypothetical protein
LQKHEAEIKELFTKVNPEDPQAFPMGRLKEFWLQLSLATRCVMVRAGTEYKLGEKLQEDAFCRE